MNDGDGELELLGPASDWLQPLDDATVTGWLVEAITPTGQLRFAVAVAVPVHRGGQPAGDLRLLLPPMLAIELAPVIAELGMRALAGQRSNPDYIEGPPAP